MGLEKGIIMDGNHQRVTRNTMMLYTRQIVILLVSLYTVKVVLRALGETDYGLYTVVAGIVTMFSAFNGAMSSASQRFFSYDLGKRDTEHLKKSFSMTLLIYGMMILLAILLMESVGLWYVLKILSVPAGRESAALFVYESSVAALCCTLLTTPYQALIIAYEDMDAYAVISIVEALLKLGVAFALQFTAGDKLIVYGALTAASTAIVTFCYRIYCKIKYKGIRFRPFWNHELFCKIFGFTGWNMFGSAVGIFKGQMVNVVLNQYFNQAVVASRGIALSVNTAAVSFSQSFGTAVRPVIIKEYAKQNHEKVFAIVSSTSKVTFLFMYIFILPLGFEMRSVLSLWLGNVSEEAVSFTVLTLMDALVESISYPLMTAAQATGKIRAYQMVVGGIQLLNFPIAWISVLLGTPAYFVLIIAIFLSVTAFVARLGILSRLMSFPVAQFMRNTILPLLASVAITILPPYLITIYMRPSFFRIIITTVVSLLFIGITFWLIGFNRQERDFAVSFLKERIK